MSKKITTEDFISRGKNIHGDKYTYEKSKYVNSKTKVTVTCPSHGDFDVIPGNFFAGHICPKCAKENASSITRLTTNEFIEKAKKVHGDKYTYEKSKYVNSKTKVTVTCPSHGDFDVIPGNFFAGHICPKCAKENASSITRLTTNEFIEKAKKVHGDKYDYSKVEYEDAHKNIIIICPIHGDFLQRPSDHLTGHGCQECAKISVSKKNSSTKEEFIEKARRVHGDKFNYSKVNYTNNKTPVIITCPDHGDFLQRPDRHLFGAGCPECGKESNGKKHRLSPEEFIKRAKEIHDNKYDYSKVNYINMGTTVIITCPKHGDYETTPSSHIYSKVGCPKCSESLGERKVRILLENLGIYNKQYYRYQSGRNSCSMDFWIPEYNLYIEVQGYQHLLEKNHFHKIREEFYAQVDRDIMKYRWAELQESPILYYIPEDPGFDIFSDPFFQGIYKPYNTFFTIEDLEKRLLDIKQ